MSAPSLEVTFRHGKALAAYLHLPKKSDEKSVHGRRTAFGMVVDFDQNGTPIGIELTAPGEVTLAALNDVLQDLGLPPVAAADLAPLRAA